MPVEELERFVTDIARSIAVQSHQGHLPVCASIWYSDGFCSQVGMGCDPQAPGELESVLLDAFQDALGRLAKGRARPVCITVWFSDRCCVQQGLPPGQRPAGLYPDNLAQCKQDIRSVLQSAGQRLTTGGILEQLQSHELHWGESTVKRALADMIRDRELTNRSDIRPRGYGLPTWD